MTVGQIIGEGLLAHGFFTKNDDKMQDYVMKTMEECGLAPYMLHRYPHQFSGGQRQRIGIARALALKPRFVVCDEAVSALDVSIQSQIVNLLKDLGEKENLAYLFISHGLSVVKYISDRIGVMYLGHMVELSDSNELYRHPLHPYTQTLLSAIPIADPKLSRAKKRIILEGEIPSPMNPPSGCTFRTRCPYATDICAEKAPELKEWSPGHYGACHNLDKVNG
jgi:peptide/nickel transport system ATP-binding protein